MLNGEYDRLFITTKLEVKYHLPTPTGQVLRIIGWVVKQNSRFARVGAEIRLSDGQVTARCEASVARPPRKFFEITNWNNEEEHWRVD
jgi:acyl-CoA thioesterase FadM